MDPIKKAIQTQDFKQKSVLVIHLKSLFLPNAKNQNFNARFFSGDPIQFLW